MRNTLEFNTPEELTVALQSYNSSMCEISTSFTILDEYLYGLAVDEFCYTYKYLQRIVTYIYDYLIRNPHEVGLVRADKKTGELKTQMQHNVSCVKKLLYVIGHFSTLESDSLIIRMDELMDAYMTYYFNYSIALAETVKKHDRDKQNKFFETKYVHAIFGLFVKFGFEIKGLDKNPDNISDIAISHPTCPSVIKVIKAFAMPRVCKIGFGFDFTKFNYRVFSHESAAKLPLKDLYTFQLLIADDKDFLLRLEKGLLEIGVNRDERQHEGFSTYVYGKVKVRVIQNEENKLIPTIPLIVGKTPEQVRRKIPQIEEFIESLPEKYSNAVGKCRGCQSTETTECWRRFALNTADKKYFICNNAWWAFPAEIDAIPYILQGCKI